MPNGICPLSSVLLQKSTRSDLLLARPALYYHVLFITKDAILLLVRSSNGSIYY